MVDWASTSDTLHMWTQIVGKIRTADKPLVNHWWQAPLYVSARGLTTSAVPYGTEQLAVSLDNAHLYTELIDARKRIVAAADSERRRIERDLHDGAQQRLVTLALDARAAEASPAR